MAGAEGDLIYVVANRIVKENNININRAKEILKSLSSKSK
jgi:hypothetical protein